MTRYFSLPYVWKYLLSWKINFWTAGDSLIVSYMELKLMNSGIWIDYSFQYSIDIYITNIYAINYPYFSACTQLRVAYLFVMLVILSHLCLTNRKVMSITYFYATQSCVVQTVPGVHMHVDTPRIIIWYLSGHPVSFVFMIFMNLEVVVFFFLYYYTPSYF